MRTSLAGLAHDVPLSGQQHLPIGSQGGGKVPEPLRGWSGLSQSADPTAGQWSEATTMSSAHSATKRCRCVANWTPSKPAMDLKRPESVSSGTSGQSFGQDGDTVGRDVKPDVNLHAGHLNAGVVAEPGSRKLEPRALQHSEDIQHRWDAFHICNIL